MRERLVEYRGLGAKFAKWRAVIDIGEHGMPSYTCVNANAHALARYAALCQDEGIVPIVEPEVLMDGDHDIDRCAEVTELGAQGPFRGAVLQPRRARRHGAQAEHGRARQEVGKRASVEEVAEKTLRVLKACVPAAVPGIAFLSGGQSDEEATAHLDAMNKMGPLPWQRHILLRPRAASRAAKGLVGQVGKRRRGAARLQPPRHDERPRHARPMEGRSGAQGGVIIPPHLHCESVISVPPRGRRNDPQRPRPRLYLVTPQLDDTAAFARALDAALDAGDVAAVLLRLADADERTLINRAKTVAAVVQRRDIALLLDGRAEIVGRAGADGAHLTGIEAFTAALATLKPDRIAGAGGLRSRHDAMLAGEAGADYVMFGEPDRARATGRRSRPWRNG